jgi:DNA-binding CsgD family transcriptional regulator
MLLIQRILERVRGWFHPRRSPFSFEVRSQTLESLRLIANREQRTPEEVAQRMVEDGLERQAQRSESLRLWQALTPREQEITALICLHYTNRQIAARLGISPETVKTHVAHVLIKLGLANRNALRQVLVDWDFGEWDE